MYADLPALLQQRTAEAFTPRETTPVDLWCDEHRTLPSAGVGANLGGKWDTDNTPYMREILRATTTPGVREVWVQKSSQVGLTELLFNIALYFVAVLGRSLLVVYPTKEKGVKVNERRLVPAIRGCAATARLLRQGGRKAATAAAVKLGPLLIWFAYTKSADSLKGDPVGPVLLDECPEPGTGGGLYKPRFCRSARDFPSHWVQGGPSDAPRSLTVAYEPGDGLAPGEGLVIAGFPAGAQLCLTALPVQPTTEPYEGEPDVVLRSVPGSCRSTPVRTIDQRPECQPVDGGGGVGPSDGIAFTDPRVTAEASAQIANYWGGGCCGR